MWGTEQRLMNNEMGLMQESIDELRKGIYKDKLQAQERMQSIITHSLTGVISAALFAAIVFTSTKRSGK